MSTLYVKGNTPLRNPQRKDKTMANEVKDNEVKPPEYRIEFPVCDIPFVMVPTDADFAAERGMTLEAYQTYMRNMYDSHEC